MQMTVRDAARALSVAEKTVYRWIQSGGLPAYRVAGQYRINRAMLFDWATSKRINFTMDSDAEEPEVAPLPGLGLALQNGGIHYRVSGDTKENVLLSVVNLLKLPDQVDRSFLYEALLARERLQSTGVGDGIALPHVRNPAVLDITTPLVCLCFLEAPVEFGALDGKPVRILFLPISPTVRIHLHLLSRISFALRNPAFKSLITNEGRRDEIIAAAQALDPESD
ncbi:MAG TPA: PTS sugar transporter subunit IIA [Kiritimatiellia bacterium]|jgi:PTS system nitrogen regulatory IIA component|nr:PTS transporter subunit EIIA [Lentisphaerota bacterium]HRV31035.1 PTS sugar transporter subunit IIA [Kiritimatiellia bacterium]